MRPKLCGCLITKESKSGSWMWCMPCQKVRVEIRKWPNEMIEAECPCCKSTLQGWKDEYSPLVSGRIFG